MYSRGVHFMNSLRWCMCCWAIYASLKLLCLKSSPTAPSAPSIEHGWSSPAINDIIVDFPAPFLPTMATRLTIVNLTVMSRKTGPCASSYWNEALLSVRTGLLWVMPTIFSGIGNDILPDSSAKSSSRPLGPPVAPPTPPAIFASFMMSNNFFASASLPPKACFLKSSKLPGWYANLPPAVKCTTSVQTLFKKSGSCETIMAVPPVAPPTQVLLMNPTSQATALVSKWFVGSSSSNTSACCAMAQANAKRIRQPPDKALTALSKFSSSNPTSTSDLASLGSSAGDTGPPPWPPRSFAYCRAGVEASMPCKMAS
mmetsp:Transcript_101464/g.310263  ORF Transcript_101464/g.310263 Transcript_101464/m.310263 type:complete len:313 (-) Transcript_101464:99-1037(-)